MKKPQRQDATQYARVLTTPELGASTGGRPEGTPLPGTPLPSAVDGTRPSPPEFPRPDGTPLPA